MAAHTTMPDMSGRTVGNGQYQLIQKLGSGSYGVVYRAVDQFWSYSSSSSRTSPRVAVKVIHKAALSPSALQRVRREVSAHREMSSHPNVVSMHDAFEDKDNIYIVLDYCPGGDMFEKVVEEKRYFRNDELAKSVFLQILDAVEACHRKRIYHRDLKPENILVSRDGSTVYLTDFGLATCNQISETFGCGSSYYMSPECIGEETARAPYSNRASDIWALGVILTNIISSRSPWNKAVTSDRCFREFLCNQDYLHEMLPISAGAQRILRRVFTFDPAQRITLPALRDAVLALDTFFMTDAEIARAHPNVRVAAAFCGLHIAPAPLVAKPVEAMMPAPPRTPPMHFADAHAHASPLASAQVFVVGELSEEASSGASSAGPATPAESGEGLSHAYPAAMVNPAAVGCPAEGIFEPLPALEDGGWVKLRGLRGLGLWRDERAVVESLKASPWCG